jgi:hypothetical protein
MAVNGGTSARDVRFNRQGPPLGGCPGKSLWRKLTANARNVILFAASGVQ